jgi:hypothetical protein
VKPKAHDQYFCFPLDSTARHVSLPSVSVLSPTLAVWLLALKRVSRRDFYHRLISLPRQSSAPARDLHFLLGHRSTSSFLPLVYFCHRVLAAVRFGVSHQSFLVFLVLICLVPASLLFPV